MFDQIEKLKGQYTDKYVVVDAARPELARFRDVVGRVRTVNMSGRALVEFEDYHLNVGWYDIDLDFLKVVDQPPPKPAKVEAKKPATKPAAAKAPEPAAKTAAPAAKAGKASVADILAAARAGKAAEPAKTPAGAAEPAKTQAVEGAKPAKVDRSKMSVAEMLAAARAGSAAGVAQATTQAAATPAKAEAKAAPAAAQPPQEEAPAESTATSDSPAVPGAIKRVDRSGMSVADMIAYCRQHDAK